MGLHSCIPGVGTVSLTSGTSDTHTLRRNCQGFASFFKNVSVWNAVFGMSSGLLVLLLKAATSLRSSGAVAMDVIALLVLTPANRGQWTLHEDTGRHWVLI